MEKRIALEGRGRNPSQVKDLNLDNCRSTSVVGLTDAYVNLHSLSLINVGLTSLKGFPKLPNLKRLELSDNRICSGLILLSASPKLAYLNLSGNKINDLETLKPLKEFNKLKNLDLFNNDVTAIEDYRTKVFNLIPTLKYLDGFDQQDREADDSDGEEDELNGNEESSEEDLASGEFDEDEEDEELSLSAVYNDQLGEESSEGDFEVSYGEEAEDEDDEDGEEDEPEGEEQNTPNNHPEESTRGKKRKLEESEPSNN